MSATLAIAALTVQEAVRRRLVLAFVFVTAALVGFSGWGFDRLHHSTQITSGELSSSLAQALILFMFMFSFVVALSASVMGSPAISSDVESGVALAVLTRPLSRSQVLFGKWLGLAAVLAGYAALVCALEFGVVRLVSGYLPPQPVVVAGFLFGEGLVLLTLALLLSTRMSATASGAIGVALFGAAWLAGVVGDLGGVFHISALREVGRIGRVVLPTDGLWRGAIYYLEPRSFIFQRFAESSGHSNPFFASAPPSWTYLVWSLIWLVVILGAAIYSFSRREI